MGEEKKWYRVIDPLNPLCGCDVMIAELTKQPGFFAVTALRRLDIFVGDRPFQLVAKEGEQLGVMVNFDHLQESPLQNEIVETGTDRPHGRCLDESEMTRKDGVTLRIARYERATQIAVEDPDDGLLTTRTETSDFRDLWERTIVNVFERGDDVEDIVYALEH